MAQVPSEANSAAGFSHVAMSGDGKLLVAVAGPAVHLLDAFSGDLAASFSGAPPGAPGYEASFSPDSQYLSSGGASQA